MKTVHLDDIEPTPIEGVNWKPLRSELGIEAFGINAYVADPGELVVPPHSEKPGAGAGVHQELYLVLRGRAVFTVVGGTIDAPAGTFVFVKPGEHREARAEEPGTTVVAIGAKLGEPYTVPPWEYPYRVRRARQLGRFDEARAVADEGTERYGEHPYLLYEQACAEAQAGRRDEALELLARAAELGPDIREWTQDEPALDAIRDDPRFGEAVGSG